MFINAAGDAVTFGAAESAVPAGGLVIGQLNADATAFVDGTALTGVTLAGTTITITANTVLQAGVPQVPAQPITETYIIRLADVNDAPLLEAGAAIQINNQGTSENLEEGADNAVVLSDAMIVVSDEDFLAAERWTAKPSCSLCRKKQQ